MKITFEIYYHTRWGESLFLSGDIDELGANEENRAVMMDYQGDGLWKYTMELPASAKKFHYEYLVKSGEGIRREWGSPHSFSPGRNAGEYRLVDRWRDVPANLPFYSSAFIQGIFFRQHADSVVETIEQGTFTVKVDAPQLRPDERLVMVGDCPELGDWDVLKAPLLNDSAFPEWQITLDGRQLKFPFEYKFVIVRTHQREVVAWETGENRICREKPQNPSEAVVVSGTSLQRFRIAVEGSRDGDSGIFSPYGLWVRHRGVYRFEIFGRLGVKNRTVVYTATPGERYDDVGYMARLLSL